MGTRGCRVLHRETNIINIEVNPVLELGQVITLSCTPEAAAALRRMGFLKVIPVGHGCHAVLRCVSPSLASIFRARSFHLAFGLLDGFRYTYT